MSEKIRLILEITENELRFLWIKTPVSWRRSKPIDILRYDSVPYVKNHTSDLLNVNTSNPISYIVKEYFLSLPASVFTPSFPIKTILLLPFSSGFLREFKVPPLSGYKLEQTIKYLLEDEVPLPPGDRAYDFVKLSEGRILIGATRRTTLASIVKDLETTGLNVIRVDFSISGITSLFRLNNTEIALFIGQYVDTLNFGVFRGYSPEFFKIHKTTNDNWEQEIFRQIRYYQMEHLYIPIKRIFAEGEKAQELAQRLVNNGIGEEWRIPPEVHFEGIPSPMETFIKGQDQGLNLLKNIQIREKLGNARKFVYLMTFLGLFLGVVLSWNAYSEVRQFRHTLSQLETKLKITEQHESRDIKKWEEWMRLKEESVELGGKISNLLAIVPNEIDVEEVELTRSTLYISGSATSGIEVQGLMKELKRSGWAEISLLRFNQQSEGKIQFVLSSAKRRGDEQ